MNEIDKLLEKATGITGARVCEISIREDGKVIWINVDGVCVCRVCRIIELVLDDRREKDG
ncbi:unnamed protein product [marine sediment metagenome]|uniref:Uncharacterized protein n=1 Tax=marine sediment metagenome TaxID=412755 RepID=X1LDZ5_9ZZZZ